MALKKVNKSEKSDPKAKTDVIASYEERIADRFNSIETDDDRQEDVHMPSNEEYYDIPCLMDDIVLNKELNPRVDIIINPDELDFEWIRQPQLISDYSDYATALEDMKRKLERKIAVKRAGLDPKIREMARVKEEKFTEPQIKAKIEKMASDFPEIRTLDKVLYQLSIIRSTLVALDHKKKGLEWISQLYMAGYFSTPSDKRLTEKSRKIVELFNDRMRDRQRDGLNNKEIAQEVEETKEETTETDKE